MNDEEKKQEQLIRELAEVRASEERYRLHFENAYDVMYALGTDLQILNISPSVESILGYRPEELLGSPFPQLNLLAPEYLEAAIADTKRAFAGERISSAVYEFIAKSGARVFGEISTVPLIQGGTVVATVSVARDISERMKTEKILREHNENLAHLSRTAMEFVELAPESNIYEVICGGLKCLVGDAIVVVASVGPSVSTFTLRAVSGLGKHTEKVFNLLGGGLIGMTFPTTDLTASLVHRGRFEKVFNSLADVDLSDRRLSRTVRAAITKILGVGNICGMGLIRHGKPFGAAFVVLRKGAEIADQEIIEAFLNQASVALLRRQAEGALRESEEKYRALVERSLQGILVLQDLRIIFANNAAAEIIGLTPDELMDMSPEGVMGFLPPEDREIVLKRLQDRMAGKPVASRNEYRVIRRNGEEFWIEVFVSVVEYRGKPATQVAFVDITERKQAEEAVLKEQRLLKQLVDLHEQERKVIAYDIHDGLVQQIAGAQMRLQSFAQVCGETPEEAKGLLGETEELLSESVREARRLISGLRPPVLDESGIVGAVDYLVHEFQRQHGHEIQFQHDVQFDRLPSPVATAVFRIVQEGLTNACRYSQSDKVRVEVAGKDSHVHVEVRDWGVGFEPAQVGDGRFGLQGIRERARLLGGEAVIETSPGEGTRITARLPYTTQTGGGHQGLR